ncbi:MAG TPA: hypothetical protein DCY07_02380 [Rhodospirillaceae bacterium]|nr:hypothetical protein [Rhodospirillaceae bacterium]
MPNFVQRWTLLALALISLSACETASSNPACVCPPIKEYSREFQERLAEEVKAALPDVNYPSALQDYATLRGQLRECRN